MEINSRFTKDFEITLTENDSSINTIWQSAKAIDSIGATTVSVGIIGEPVLAIVLAYLLLGETMSLFQLLGGIITLLGMGMYFWSKSLKYNIQNK
ncbi:EamA family transporter [Paenibacillus sp. FSL L8-0323]|uniref:EamA family transporter n=1 Tax=Paenibacillus sp. FSL L8-0323 TaxID=2975330 RepID=UPI0030FBFCE3